MARGLRRRVVPVLLPGLLGAAALITIDQLLGPAVFGTLAVIPAVTANAGQSIELVRSRRVVGVSVLFLILAVTNQGLWLSWAMLVPDIGTITVAAVTGTITVFNLTWWSLRTLGLRPFRLPLPRLTGTAAPGEALQPAGSAPPRSDDRGHC